ncbi:sialic acid-binding Ig-like lectin 14 [Labeo rohita]|uniref:Sialic acid-binding Ig-like lectin 14 n=1 Tax=Labeo rohita TaxID=84645 RepID=A0A498MW75_LABRO|nr:sialic acid-binding Ig-like lectin 14 [Labeo rohita]
MLKDSFRGRTKLLGSLGDSNCTLEIDEVRNHDNGPYCFRVELETSKKDKYSFVNNCVSVKMIEQASKPELQGEQSLQEGEPAVFKCSVKHTCPSHQPTLTWSHSGNTIMGYKDIGHGNWEAESLLTFTPTKEDDHTSVTCTVKYHGNVQVICVGVFADVWKVHVESEMEALVSSCVVLPCSFKYPAQQQPSDRIRAMWHIKNKWDDIIFHKDQTRVLDNFKGRTKLLGSLGGSNCSLEIDEVRNHDNGPYCFRVEVETSQKDKYSFVENCVSINMIEQASKPELQAEQSLQEGQPAVFKCSVKHTCSSHQPTLTWSHPGKTIMSYKDIGHGNWEAESLLTFTPTKEDDHGSITCTVKYHGNAKGEMTATRPIFVKEQANLSHILIPVISCLGTALLVGLLCFFIGKRYK